VGAVVLLVCRSGAVLNGVLLPGKADARLAASVFRLLSRAPRPLASAPAVRAPGLMDTESGN
jgi:hypothetical protein